MKEEIKLQVKGLTASQVVRFRFRFTRFTRI